MTPTYTKHFLLTKFLVLIHPDIMAMTFVIQDLLDPIYHIIQVIMHACDGTHHMISRNIW